LSVGIAVVGAGGWGKNHVRNFAALEGARLLYVCDHDPKTRERHAAQYPNVKLVESVEEALADDAVDAVVVATDAPSHHRVAKQALVSGRDVLVEKPLAMTTADAAALCTLADEGSRILMVGHLLLYHPAVRALKGLIDAGDLGDPMYLVAQRTNLGVVRQDENAWWSLAPHDISLAMYFFDAQPKAVAATGGVFLQREKGIEDVVFGTVHFDESRLAHVHVSWLDPHKVRRITVVGSRRMAVFDDTSPDQKLMVFDKGVEPPETLSWDQGVRIRTGDIRIPAVRMAEPLRRECEAFLEAVRTRKAPVADGRSGLGVVQALEAGAKSLMAHGARVDVG